MVKVLIWTKHPHDILGEGIDFVTRGIAQHAGFKRSNGMIHELYAPKVRDRAIVPEEQQYIREFDIVGLTQELSDKLERHFDVMLEQGGQISYSYEDLFRILLNIPSPPDGSMVCSQYVFHMLNMIGLPPLVRCTDDFISPRDLYITPALIGPA